MPKGLRVSWTAKKTNEWVLNTAGVERSLLASVRSVKERKVVYFGALVGPVNVYCIVNFKMCIAIYLHTHSLVTTYRIDI